MTAILRIALLATLAAASNPAVAPAQGTAIDSLNRRVVLLERQVAALGQRLSALEALIKIEPLTAKPVQASANWHDLANWRQLRLGMTSADVHSLLGEPERVEGGPVTYWYWANAKVYFIAGELAGWSEPRE